jgi:hypothetical protein
MANCCESKSCEVTALRERCSDVLWIVLAINASMFMVEGVAGVLANSTSLLADALDMLGDALVYGSSLFVIAGSALTGTGGDGKGRVYADVRPGRACGSRVQDISPHLARPGHDGDHRRARSGGKRYLFRIAVSASCRQPEHELDVAIGPRHSRALACLLSRRTGYDKVIR